MKIHRKTICLLLLIFLLPITVFAHSGKTDSHGGHTDHSTGEYHYHHGYPEHDHYDMDGDSIADCPYNFEDKTNYNSGIGVDDTDTESERYPSEELDATEKPASKNIFRSMLKSLLPAIGIGLLISYILSYLLVFILGDDKGCSTSLICFVVLSIIAYIWLIFADLS